MIIVVGGDFEQNEIERLSQIELAAKMGTTAVTISRWENGSRKPDPDAIVKLAEILKCSTDDLLNPPQPSTPS